MFAMEIFSNSYLALFVIIAPDYLVGSIKINTKPRF